MHIGKMLDISDEDAADVIRDIAVSFASHHLMSEVLGEMVTKYDKKAILAGMMIAKTFNLCEIEETTSRKHDYGNG